MRLRAVRLIFPPLVLAMGIACDSGPPPNLLLVVVDTLRADHLGSYGYALETSPHIDALAAGGVRFERANSTSPWTMPSIASILTGQHPRRHGLMGMTREIPSSAVTLAERLRGAGYHTAAVVSHMLLERRFGFDKGFDVFESRAAGNRAVTGSAVTAAAVAMLGGLVGRETGPFFLFVHYFDPHFAYRGHSAYAFAGKQVGRLVDDMPYRELVKIRGSLTPPELHFVRALYDEEIRYTDAQIGILLGALAQSGADDDTLVVVTADHGEEFMEHGWIGHTISLHGTLLHVPLVMGPARFTDGARVVPDPVSLAALAPTLLELLGLPSSDPAFDADSFAPLARGEGGAPEAVFSEVDYHQHPGMRASQRMVLVHPHKLIEDRLSGGVSLFDLSEDPGEQRDLSARRPEVVASLRAELARIVTALGDAAPAPAAPLSEEARERLRDLGYLE